MVRWLDVLMKFRAKVSTMGDKVHIIIPKAYRKDIDQFINEFVDVELRKV